MAVAFAGGSAHGVCLSGGCARPASAHSHVLRDSSAFVSRTQRRPRLPLGPPAREPWTPRRPVRRRGVAVQMIDAPALGGVQEALILLVSTVVTVPIFRRFKVSPILGFLLSGVLLGPHGLRLVKDVEDITELADFGVLFLLFEMGLELSIDRLTKLRKYAFGLGALQVTITSVLLSAGAYAMGASGQEALVIGPALSLSSSAFVLQLLAERGERANRTGTASFGVLLFQDIAVVPLLVLVPLLSSSGWVGFKQVEILATAVGLTLLKALAVLSVSVLVGGQVLKILFSIVADSESPEAFTALILLTVLGTGWFTEEAGLSNTLGAFLGGVLLAETNFRSRIMADIEPFRGLLLGLFFITTGMSLDLELFTTRPLDILFLISSLVAVKTAVTSSLALAFGLSLAESVRVGLVLGQGGEFAFVLFALANNLGFLAGDVNNILVVTVVASMAMTPALADLGKFLGPYLDRYTEASGGTPTPTVAIEEAAKISESPQSNLVVVCGFGPVGQVVGRMLARKFVKFVAVDSNQSVVREAEKLNSPCVQGDCRRLGETLEQAGIVRPAAIVITFAEESNIEDTIASVRVAYPEQPIFVRARDYVQLEKFRGLGADVTVADEIENSCRLGGRVLKRLGTTESDARRLVGEIRKDKELMDAFKFYEKRLEESVQPKQISASDVDSSSVPSSLSGKSPR